MAPQTEVILFDMLKYSPKSFNAERYCKNKGLAICARPCLKNLWKSYNYNFVVSPTPNMERYCVRVEALSGPNIFILSS